MNRLIHNSDILDVRKMRMPTKLKTQTFGQTHDHPSTRMFKRTGLIALFTMALAQGACAPSRFAEYGAGGSGSDNQISLKTTHMFDTQAEFSQERPLDLTWVIDNSPSMTEEAAHVRNNFLGFVDAVKQDADLKVALISRAGASGTNVRLPLSGSNSLQIDRYVWSTDSLEIAAAAFCPPTPVAGTACAEIRGNARTSDLGKIAGKLKSFLRADSKKAFVFVTDDESRVVSGTFAKAFDEAFPGQRPVIFSFIGQGKTASPCAARTGVQYANLSAATAGASYNICEKDWSETFAALANNVVRQATKPVAVPGNLTRAEQINYVLFNGVTMNPEDYTLTPGGLVFDPSWTRDLTTAKITVCYQTH